MFTDTHECGIDCKPERTPTGGTAHIMFPATPNSSAGRYQAAQNVGMTRREYRASGQDESRNVRIWNRDYADRAWKPKTMMTRSEAADLPGDLPELSHFMRISTR